MSLNDKLTAIATALRSQYGSTDKLSLDDMTKGIDGLNVHNYLNEGRTFDSKTSKDQTLALPEVTTDVWNKLTGKTVTFSFDLTWSGYHSIEGKETRIGIEFGLKYQNIDEQWVGSWYYPKETDGSTHVSFTTLLPEGTITDYEEGNFFNQLNSDCVVKATNMKIVVNPMN